MPEFWDWAVLVAPMFKIADDVKPHPLVISVLTKLCSFIPTWKIIPTKDINHLAFKRPQIREQVPNSIPFMFLRSSQTSDFRSIKEAKLS
ncbi:hypothetical protein SAY87_006499 [Trapa incisa]|uniref:Uncharacterized protein n=1 Tax=Trapa incisa TaxID=236973 RepID=A0AAN7JZU4_9MYRT|nr:hypothetical protein SAY87_006499 [Trapa incisa]